MAVFTMVMDVETGEALEQLAKADDRSKAGVIRWLVKRECDARRPGRMHFADTPNAATAHEEAADG